MDEQQRAKEVQGLIETAKAFGLEWDNVRASAAFDEITANIQAFKERNSNVWQEAEQRAEATRLYMGM